jgi:spermidine/putrescine transport system permease protein
VTTTAVRPARTGAATATLRDRLRNPWGRPRFLGVITWLYILWSLVPVLLAIRFAFNEGRSRTAAQGWSMRWFWQDPTLSVFHDPTLRQALVHSLELAALVMVIAVPLGTMLALGLHGWTGRLAAPVNVVLLLPLVTPGSCSRSACSCSSRRRSGSSGWARRRRRSGR